MRCFELLRYKFVLYVLWLHLRIYISHRAVGLATTQHTGFDSLQPIAKSIALTDDRFGHDAHSKSSRPFPSSEPAMPKAIEARSLTELTQLASSPPNDLQDHAQDFREPLVLYIVRVPGSRGQQTSIKANLVIAAHCLCRCLPYKPKAAAKDCDRARHSEFTLLSSCRSSR